MDSAAHKRVSVGRILDVMGQRGFGPLLLLPSLLVISPVGELPGACAVLGAILFLISIQIVMGQDTPWFPRALRDITFSGKKFSERLKKMKPFTKSVDKYLENRLSSLASNEIVIRFTAFVCLLLSIAIAVLSIIPLAPLMLGLPSFAFSLGMTARDGVILLLGYLLLIPAVAALIHLS